MVVVEVERTQQEIMVVQVEEGERKVVKVAVLLLQGKVAMAVLVIMGHRLPEVVVAPEALVQHHQVVAVAVAAVQT